MSPNRDRPDLLHRDKPFRSRLGPCFYSFIISTDLKGDNPLPACGKKDFARKNLNKELPAFETDLILRQRESKPLKSGAGEHDRIPIVLREFAQASWHIAAKIDDLEVRTFAGKLMFPSHTTGRDGRTFPKRG